MRIPPYFNVYWLDSLPPSSEYRGTMPIMSNRLKRFRLQLVAERERPTLLARFLMDITTLLWRPPAMSSR